MYFRFVWYLLCMVFLFVKMLLTIPKALVVGFYSGVEDSGLIPGIKKALAQSGMRQVMWDNLTELFEDRYGIILCGILSFLAMLKTKMINRVSQACLYRVMIAT